VTVSECSIDKKQSCGLSISADVAEIKLLQLANDFKDEFWGTKK